MSNAGTLILVGVASLALEIILAFEFSQISLLDHELYSPWLSKNLMAQICPKKFMQLGVDVKCMHTNFGGCDFCFRSYCYFQKWPNFPSESW